MGLTTLAAWVCRSKTSAIRMWNGFLVSRQGNSRPLLRNQLTTEVVSSLLPPQNSISVRLLVLLESPRSPTHCNGETRAMDATTRLAPSP